MDLVFTMNRFEACSFLEHLPDPGGTFHRFTQLIGNRHNGFKLSQVVGKIGIASIVQAEGKEQLGSEK